MSITYSDLLMFTLSLFLFHVPTWLLHYIKLSYLLRQLLALAIFQTFLVLMTLTLLRITGHVFCRMSLYYLMFSSQIDWGLWRRPGLNQKYNQHCLSLLLLTLMNCLMSSVCQVCLYKNLPRPSPYCTLWKKVTMHSSHLRSRELYTPFEGSVST